MIALIYEEVHNSDDREFMLTIYHDYIRLMYHTANKYCENTYDCEEIVQDTILKLIEKIPVLRTLEEKALAAYVVVSVRNTAFSLQRRRTTEQKLFAPWKDEIENIPDSELSVEEKMIMLERKGALLVVWSMLSEEERFLLEGRYILRYTDYELSQELGVKAGAIRMRLTRTRRKVLFLMQTQIEGEGVK